MRTISSIVAAGAIAMLISLGGIWRMGVQANGGITVPGNIADLPHANGVTYDGPPRASAPLVTTRQALDAAEHEFRLTDSQIDVTARAVPVVVSIGLTPALHHITAWVVTADVDIVSAGRIASQAAVTHKMCIVIDGATGKYIMAYACGPRYAVNP